jgi:hypothetical protein
MALPFAEIRSRAIIAAVLSAMMVLATLLPFAGSASAQDATPEPAASAAPADLPVIIITVREDTYSIKVPGSPVVEGQYLIQVVNTTDTLAVANIVELPEGVSFGDLSSTLFTSFKGTGGALPEWWPTATFIGGSWAGPGATSETVANLTAGRWTVFSGNPASAQPAQNFTISAAEPEEAADGATPVASPIAVSFPELDTAATVDVSDTAVTAASIPGGPALLGVTNSGAQPHDLVFYQVADGTDAAGAAAIATAVAAGTPPADATLFASIGLISPGSTGYIVSNLQPGTYAVFSTAPDANGGLQSDAGVVAVVVVS